MCFTTFSVHFLITFLFLDIAMAINDVYYYLLLITYYYVAGSIPDGVTGIFH